ncbi:unnamed protein product [Phaeothamnion confervicola]
MRIAVMYSLLLVSTLYPGSTRNAYSSHVLPPFALPQASPQSSHSPRTSSRGRAPIDLKQESFEKSVPTAPGRIDGRLATMGARFSTIETRFERRPGGARLHREATRQATSRRALATPVRGSATWKMGLSTSRSGSI